MTLKTRKKTSCRYDLVILGECMIRLSLPEHERLEFARRLEVWVGGADTCNR